LQLVVAEYDLLETDALGQVLGDLTLEGVLPQAEDLEMGAGRQLNWYAAVKRIDAQVEVDDLSEASELCWDASMESIV
jgi:hypothetical protein